MNIKILLASTCLFCAHNAMADVSSPCTGFADTMTKRAVEIFHDTSLSEAQKRSDLGKIFQEAVDTDWIGRFVLGRFWNAATPEQQADYLQTYRNYLTHTYISKFNDEDGMNVSAIQINSFAPATDGGYEAKTLIQMKADADVHVDYLLDDAKGKCQVHDVKIEGVSLLVSGRSEFSALAGTSGVQGIIDAMKKKIAN